MKFVLPALFSSLFLPFAASGQGSQDDWDVQPVDYGFTTWDANVVGYRGAGGDVEIPAYYRWFTASTYTVAGILKSDGWPLPEEAGIFGDLPVTSVVIPETVRTIGANAFAKSRFLTNATVTVGYSLKIGEGAFRDCTALTNVLFHHLWGYLDYRGETAIGERAFAGCTNLSRIPDGVTRIANEAFLNCTGFPPDNDPLYWSHPWTGLVGEITIPNSVTNIEGNPFLGCGVSSFYVEPANTNYTTRDGILYDKSVTRLVAVPPLFAMEAYVIPNSVTNIPISAFVDSPWLTSITIPNGVASIGADTFRGCARLTDVIIGQGVKDIGDRAFLGCASLRQVNIPNGVTRIGNSAFQSCSSLTNVIIPVSVISIQNSAFQGCSSITNVTISDGVTDIGDNAFQGNAGMRTLTIGNAVTNIGYRAFNQCIELKTVTIPSSVKIIGNGAFSHCTGLTNVHISRGVSIIDVNAFDGCSGLTSVVIPDGVTNVCGAAFSHCTNLTSVRVSKTVLNIGGDRFGTPYYNFGGVFAGTPKLQSVLFEGNAPLVRDGEQFTSPPATVYYLEGTQGWGETFAGAPTKVFKPFALPSSMVSNAFHFKWTNTGTIPMNVQRATSLAGPWTVVSSNNSTGQFVDTNPPSGRAFYRAVLP